MRIFLPLLLAGVLGSSDAFLSPAVGQPHLLSPEIAISRPPLPRPCSRPTPVDACTLSMAAAVAAAMGGEGGASIEIARFDISSLTPAEFHRLWDHPEARPCVVEGVFSAVQLDEICRNIVEAMEGQEVEYQLRSSATGMSELMRAAFPEFMEVGRLGSFHAYHKSHRSLHSFERRKRCCMYSEHSEHKFHRTMTYSSQECFDSDHATSALLFDEGTLPSLAGPGAFICLPEKYFGRDIFDRFPEPVRPMGSCLIMGGEGSRSTLHADPYEWMGWNLCLEGVHCVIKARFLFCYAPCRQPGLYSVLRVSRTERRKIHTDTRKHKRTFA